MDKNLKEILDILEECDFDFLDSKTYRDKIIYYFKQKYKKPFWYESGASKLALIFENLPYVIKIPFSGYYSNDGDEEYGDFCNAGSEGNWDYCEVEENIYKYAEKNGLADCFAKTEKIATINGYPIYKQEYVTVYDYGESSCHTQQDEEKISSFCEEEDFYACEQNWLADVLAYFGETIFNKLVAFIRQEDINDLHNGNIGYIGLKPVLMDYSGWDEWL